MLNYFVAVQEFYFSNDFQTLQGENLRKQTLKILFEVCKWYLTWLVSLTFILAYHGL